MNNEDAWFYCHNEVRVKIGFDYALKSAENVFNAMGSRQILHDRDSKVSLKQFLSGILEREGCGEVLQGNNCLIAFCRLFIMVLMDSNGTISSKQSIKRKMAQVS